MALQVGVNCGFVTVAPTGAPGGVAIAIDGSVGAGRFTAPAGIVAISQMGWYEQGGGLETNFEVGLYANNAANSTAGSAQILGQTNAAGTTAGWKTANASVAVVSGVIYWLACQMDAVTGARYIDTATITAEVRIRDAGETTLLDPFVTTAVLTTDSIFAIYAVGIFGAGAGGTTHYPTGAISGVSYLTAAGWSVNRYMSGSISGVGNLVNFGLPVTHYVTGCVSGVSYLTATLTKQANNINIVSNISAAPHHTRDGSDGLLVKGGIEAQDGYFTDAGVGQTITFTAQDGRTVTVSKGIIVAIS